MNARRPKGEKDPTAVKVGERISAVREERRKKEGRRFTQDGLAEQMTSITPGGKVTGSMISKWERGMFIPEGPYRAQLAEKLGVEYSELFAALPDVERAGAESLSLHRIERLEDQVAALIYLSGFNESTIEDLVRAAEQGRRRRAAEEAGRVADVAAQESRPDDQQSSEKPSPKGRRRRAG